MKNLLKVLFAASLAVFFFSQGFAQTTAKSGTDNSSTGTAVQGKFVDVNGNGVCDNHEAKGKDGKCANFVDKDGNGVCDNCGTANCSKNANCQGQGCQHRHGDGQGAANCCGKGPCGGKGQGNCCPNKQGQTNATPSETPEPKK
jgi:hypothetical protein